MTAARHWENLDELEREEFGALLPEQADSWDALAQVGHRQHVQMTAARHWEKLRPEKNGWPDLVRTAPGVAAFGRDNCSPATATWHCDRTAGPRPLPQLLVDIP